jgi:hypothetical protein
MFTRLLAFALAGSLSATLADNVSLPERRPDAPAGREFAERISSFDLAAREREVLSQVTQGNMPHFWRQFAEVKVTRWVDGTEHTAAYRVSPDYLALGSDRDYLLMPVTPATAQAIADILDCSLPTPRMVNDIFAAAPVKLEPAPIPPSPAMTSVPVFLQHNAAVFKQRAGFFATDPLGTLVAGHKKDVVLTRRLADSPGKVAIYGWHRTNGEPIQPLYLSHTATWVDYSHGARFVRKALLVDGQTTTLESVLADPALSVLLSDEGPLPRLRYPVVMSSTNTPPSKRSTALGSRVQFWLKENPTRAVLHTRQVELNGFIHAVLAGTELEFRDYTYFGPRVYGAWIGGQ